MESLDNCTDPHFALIVGLTGACKTPAVSSASKSITPVSVKHPTSVNPVPSSLHRWVQFAHHRFNRWRQIVFVLIFSTCISSQSFQFLSLGPKRNHRRCSPSGLVMPIFSLSSLEPKRLRMVILTIILVQVLCCLYQSPKHYIEIWHERPFSLQMCSEGRQHAMMFSRWTIASIVTSFVMSAFYVYLTLRCFLAIPSTIE